MSIVIAFCFLDPQAAFLINQAMCKILHAWLNQGSLRAYTADMHACIHMCTWRLGHNFNAVPQFLRLGLEIAKRDRLFGPWSPRDSPVFIFQTLRFQAQDTLCLFKFRGLSSGTHPCTASFALTSFLCRLPLQFEGVPGTADVIPKHPAAVIVIPKESLQLPHPTQMMPSLLWPRSLRVLQPLDKSNSILHLYSFCTSSIFNTKVRSCSICLCVPYFT